MQATARICIPANLVDNDAWDSPPAGGKMASFKNDVLKEISDAARDMHVKEMTEFTVDDKFDAYVPGSTKVGDFIRVYTAFSRADPCPRDGREYTLPVQTQR